MTGSLIALFPARYQSDIDRARLRNWLKKYRLNSDEETNLSDDRQADYVYNAAEAIRKLNHEIEDMVQELFEMRRMLHDAESAYTAQVSKNLNDLYFRRGEQITLMEFPFNGDKASQYSISHAAYTRKLAEFGHRLIELATNDRAVTMIDWRR